MRDAGERPAAGEVHLLAAADPANPYGAALPWPRRGEDDRRPLQRAAGAYVVLVDGVAALYLERGGATLQTLPPADDPAVARDRGRGAPRARRRRPAPRAGDPQGRRRGRRRRPRSASGCSAPGSCAGYRGLVLRPHAGLSARGRHALPDRGRAPAVPRRPGRHRGADAGPGAGPAGRIASSAATIDGGRVARQEPADPLRQRPRAPDPPADERLVAPLPAGRALAPAAGAGAARPRGPGRGRGLLRCPGRRAARDAGRGAPPGARPARAGPARARLRCRRGAPPAARPVARRHGDREALLDQRALAGIGNVYKNEILWIERVSPFARVADVDDETLDRLVATARRLLVANVDRDARPGARHDRRRPRRARPALRLRPRRPAVPPLPDADPLDAAGRRTCRARRTGARPVRARCRTRCVATSTTVIGTSST